MLIVASWFPDAASPLNGIFVQEQAELLARSYDVAVLVPRYLGWRQRFGRNPGPRSRREMAGPAVVQREWEFAPVPYFQRLSLGRYLRAARRGFAALLTDWGRPDLIHAHVVLPGGWAALSLARQHGVPALLTEHSSPFAMHLGSPAQRARVRATLAGLARTLAVSPGLAEQITAFAPEARVDILGNVIRTEFFAPATAPAPRDPAQPARLFCLALLSPQKGLTFLLEAMQLLSQRGGPACELVIGGDGPERAALERRAAELGLSGRCRFVGLLDRAAARAWMQWCDLFVLPSLHETFGIVVGEAMACGKPVLATRCGGPEYLVTPASGTLVEPANAGALADAIAAWSLQRDRFDPALIRQSVVERFGEAAFLRNLTAVYRQVWGE